MLKKDEYFKQIVSTNIERIRRISRYYAPTEEDAKDICQEVLINIWKSLDKFKGISEISTWIYRIAVNTSLTFTGKQYKNMKLNVSKETVNITNLIENENDENTISEQNIAELQLQLNLLSIIDKALISLVLEGLTTKEIADIIGITEVNVRVKIHRIKATLRKNLNREQT